ncbi:CheY-like superfamily [Dimargaris cristalligena]|uniref:CheY-like superfamily n=1 Tax=Dimargaris cristalligena TaxID=215637 RepID=A0A4P9ZJC8_9FUNG|nr:CheY-like superfamily [Dimargaris cristalligena]|eukprot:RKP33346.1 CheY-like superfamily [Dimargaris cristalligena]
MLCKHFADVCGWEDMRFVKSGQAALDELNQHTYDLVLLDIDMPGLTGVETAERIRAGQPYVRDDNAQLPIIAVTSSVQAHQRLRYSEAGINECVSKPVQIGELRRAISHVTLPVATYE